MNHPVLFLLTFSSLFLLSSLVGITGALELSTDSRGLRLRASYFTLIPFLRLYHLSYETFLSMPRSASRRCAELDGSSEE
ncbi:hypothetical protein DFH94DRAFT_769843 [Russula ochroleuca]|jgi:hypothetical protein|uniref:Secreted protein n=1 Tax=Russula ochroleuca TaxID=152965 RepID=A0A9P5JYI1_9AGAM|nr:hypothetical protein DFH94DRAFT_769843 [Russula ochroleuca]